MQIGSCDVKGSRLYSEQQFREDAIQVLVATEAAGECSDLQSCHIMFNYDIPWNPNGSNNGWAESIATVRSAIA